MRIQQKSGIYVIELVGTDKFYIGSSKWIYQRWTNHKNQLRKETHHSPYLQNAWNKYGEDAFKFWVIEECSVDVLLIKEQEYIDAFKPEFNICKYASSRRGVPWSDETKEAVAKIWKEKQAKITHCPRGHEYTESNTYYGPKGGKICRECNRLRVEKIYASETPEQREARRIRAKNYHESTKADRLEKMREYTLKTKARKQEYDRANRSKANERKRKAIAEMSPEQKALYLQKKRESYWRNKA